MIAVLLPNDCIAAIAELPANKAEMRRAWCPCARYQIPKLEIWQSFVDVLGYNLNLRPRVLLRLGQDH